MDYQETLLLNLAKAPSQFGPPKKRKITKINDEIIETKWKELENGTIDPVKFIWEIAAELKHGKLSEGLKIVDEGK